MIRARDLCGCLAAFGLLAVAVDKVGGAPILTIDLLPGAGLSTENTGASGRLTLAFYQHKDLDYLSLTVENTTPISLGSKLTAVGLEMPTFLPSRPVFAADGVGTYFKYLEYDVSVSPGWLNAPGGYDLALTSDRNFLGGGAQGAPGAGESHKVTLALGNTGYTPEELSSAFLKYYGEVDGPIAIVRFQSVGPRGKDSDRVISTKMIGEEVIPEPATVAFLVVGGAVLAVPGRWGSRARR